MTSEPPAPTEPPEPPEARGPGGSSPDLPEPARSVEPAPRKRSWLDFLDRQPSGPGPEGPEAGKRGESAASGVGYSCLLHLLQVPLAILAWLVFSALFDAEAGAGVAFGSLLLVGVSQLFYMIPAIVIARRRGRTALAQGFIIGAAVVFLLNAGCWGLVFGAGVFGPGMFR